MKNNFVLLFIVIAITFVAKSSFSQVVKLKDYTTHLPIPFANVQNVSSKVFYAADVNGKVNVTKYNEGDTLLITQLNYISLYVFPSDFKKTNTFYLFPKPYTGPIAEIVGRIEKKNDVLSQVEIIDAKKIEYKNVQNAADVLQSTGNVLVQKSQLGGGSPIIRGFEANKVLLVLDGVRLNNAIYRSGHLQNAVTIDNNVLKNVEVLFGPSSVMYGSDALGGVVYYKTKDPKLSIDNGEQNLEASVMQRYSSASQESTFHFDLNVGYNKWGFLTSFTKADYGDLKMGTRRTHGDENWGLVNEYQDYVDGVDATFVNPDPTIQKHTAYQQLDFLQKIIFNPKTDLKFTLNLNYSTSSDVPRFDQYNDYNDGELKWAEWDYGPQNRLMVSLRTDFLKARKLYDALHITASSQLIDEDRITRRYGSATRTIREEDVSVYALNIDVNKEIDKKSKIYYGSEITYNIVESTAESIDIDTNEISEAIARYPDGGSTLNTAAVFVGYNRKLTKKTSLKTGLRYSNSVLESNFLPSQFYDLPYSNITLNNGAFTGSLGLKYLIDSTFQVSMVAASGYRTPNVDDIGKIREKSGFVTVPNDQLKPEYAYNGEVSIQKTWKKEKMKISGTGFYTFLNNAIVQRDGLIDGNDFLIIEGDTAQTVTNKNAAEAVIYGFNVNLSTKLYKNFSFKGSYNYTFGQDLTDDVPLSHIAPVFGLAELTYGVEKFSATLNTMFNGEKPLELYGAGSSDNLDQALEDGTPPWWTLNLYTSYYVSPIVKIQFSVENILDMHYRVFASGISAPGRNYVISVRASF